MTEERDNFKSQFQKLKEKYDESHANQTKYQEECLFAREKIKHLEDKVKNLDYKNSALKNTLKDKDNHLEEYKNDLVTLENYRKERIETDKKLSTYHLKITSLKEENEKKTNRQKELEISKVKLHEETDNKIKSYNKKFKEMELSMKSLKNDKENLIKQNEELNKKNKDQEKIIEDLNMDIRNKQGKDK